MTTKRLFTIAGAVILFIFVVATINWIGVQQNRTSALRGDIANLQGQISNLKYDLNNTIISNLEYVKQGIVSELERQNSNIFDASYTITGYNKAESLAYVKISFTLKEYSISEPVTIAATREGNSQTVIATNNDGIFEANIALKFENRSSSKNGREPTYTYSLSYRMGTDKVLSEKIMDIRPGNDLYGRISTNIATTEIKYLGNKQQRSITIQPSVQNNFGANEKLEFMSCKMYIAYDGKILETIDLMGSITAQNGRQVLDIEPIKFDYIVSSDLPYTVPFPADGTYTMDGYNIYIVSVDGYGFECILLFLTAIIPEISTE